MPFVLRILETVIGALSKRRETILVPGQQAFLEPVTLVGMMAAMLPNLASTRRLHPRTGVA